MWHEDGGLTLLICCCFSSFQSPENPSPPSQLFTAATLGGFSVAEILCSFHKKRCGSSEQTESLDYAKSRELTHTVCADDPPIDVEIGSKFTIATTTTTNFEEEFPCEVVGSTMAPPLPLMGTVFASESDITRTLKCTITKGAEMAMCQFSVRLTGEPNVPATAQAFADDDAPGATPTPPVPPEPVFFIE